MNYLIANCESFYGINEFNDTEKILNQIIDKEKDVVLFGSESFGFSDAVARNYITNNSLNHAKVDSIERIIEKLKNRKGEAILFWDGNCRHIRNLASILKKNNIEYYFILYDWVQKEQGVDGSWHFGYNYYSVFPIEV